MNVNYLAILVAAIASMVIGSIWYGPLFGKMFRTLMGMDQWSPEKQAEMKKAMTMTYIWQFIASLVMFYVLAVIMAGMGKGDVSGGLQAGFWVWLGFIVTTQLGNALWGGKMKLFWLGAGNSLVTVLVGGAIIGMWH